jgi:hypothetical protein
VSFVAEKQLTEKERIEFLRRDERNKAAYAAVKDALSLIDLTQNKSITYTTYSRESLRSYLQNPASESNQKNLRKLSNYLYTVSHVYRRLINFKAYQIQLKSWTVYPDIPLTEDPDVESILQNYEKVTKYIRNMDMKSQILKCMLQAWKNDVVYGFCYGDPESDGEFFIHLLDPDYCKISSQQYYRGVLNFAFDFSYFDSGTNSYYLDIYDPIFKKLYNKYKSDNTQRWAELPIENTFCLKINIDTLDYPIPPLSGLFDSIISLADLQSIQDLKDELDAYKLIYAKIDTISGTKDVDDFEIDLELANKFYQKLQSVLPENIALAMSPMKLDTIDFDSNNAKDVNIISQAYENIINANGGIVLNQNKITNSASFNKALQFDSMDAMAPVEQINAWVNLWILNHLGETGMIVEYSDVSPYFVDDRIDKLLKVAQYSVPVKLELASLLNANPVKERGMSFMEEVLGMGTTSWNKPLVSSNVQNGDSSENGDGSEGRTEIDNPDDLSDEGQKSRDKK